MAERKPKAEKQQPTTQYVVLRAVPYRDEDATAPSEAWEPVGAAAATRGQEAIKAVTLQDDGSHEGGRYKAVAVSGWDSDGNNLQIVTQTKKVSSFVAPGSVNIISDPVEQPE